METLAPRRFTISVTRTASANCVPATKRLEKRTPRAEFSAKWRIDWLSESWIKAVLSMPSPVGQNAGSVQGTKSESGSWKMLGDDQTHDDSARTAAAQTIYSGVCRRA